MTEVQVLKRMLDEAVRKNKNYPRMVMELKKRVEHWKVENTALREEIEKLKLQLGNVK